MPCVPLCGGALLIPLTLRPDTNIPTRVSRWPAYLSRCTRTASTMSLLPSLEIHLDHSHEHVYQPNAKIPGYVALTYSRHDVDIQKLAKPSISLSGESSTWLCRRRSNGDDSSEYINYIDTAELFGVSLALGGAGTEPTTVGQEYRWSFSFRFPEGTGNNRTGCYKHSDDERRTTLPHPLPPTFSFGNNLRHIFSDLPKYVDVSYRLGAMMSLPLDFLSAKAIIPFQPINPDFNPRHPRGVLRFSTQHTLHSSLLKRGEETSSTGLRQRIHDRFSSSAPELRFDLALDIPETFTADAEFHLEAILIVTSRTENVAHIPPIRFRISKIELIDHTCLRAPVDFGQHIKRISRHNIPGRKRP